MNTLTARAIATLELAGDFIARADAQHPPEHEERRVARARFLRAADLVIKVAAREPVYWHGVLLPAWPVATEDEQDPRLLALEEVARGARVDAERLGARTAELMAEPTRVCRLAQDYMRTLPEAKPRRRTPPSVSHVRRIPITRDDQLTGLDGANTPWLAPDGDLELAER